MWFLMKTTCISIAESTKMRRYSRSYQTFFASNEMLSPSHTKTINLYDKRDQRRKDFLHFTMPLKNLSNRSHADQIKSHDCVIRFNLLFYAKGSVVRDGPRP